MIAYRKHDEFSSVTSCVVDGGGEEDEGDTCKDRSNTDVHLYTSFVMEKWLFCLELQVQDAVGSEARLKIESNDPKDMDNIDLCELIM